MRERSESSLMLYDYLREQGYPEVFCDLITRNLNTDFTAGRMLGYLSHYSHLPEEVILVGAPQFGQLVVFTSSVPSVVFTPFLRM